MSEIKCTHPEHCNTSIEVLGYPRNGEISIELYASCFPEDWENLSREILLDIESVEKLITDLQKAITFVKLNQNE